MATHSTTWNNDPRAVVPSAELLDSNDIVCATYDHSGATSFPFGLAVYTHDGQQLPLLFVSPRAAHDRSPTRNPLNAAGVRPGWYVLAKPGSDFQVRYTRVSMATTDDEHETLISAHLYVGGEYTFFSTDYYQDSLYDDHVATGFATRDEIAGGTSLLRWVRKFRFEKAETTENSGKNTLAGTIQLQATAGEATAKTENDEIPSTASYKESHGAAVSEKAAAKEGLSLEVRGGEVARENDLVLSRFVSKNERNWPEAGITIHIREKSWLRSRRIVDDDDKPVSYEDFIRLLEVDSSRNSGGDSTGHGEPARKRQRAPTTAKPNGPPEVIDLT